jgi:hypothetical protein
MKRIALIALLALAGCATPTAPTLNVDHQIVYLDRPVAAVKAADVPKPPCKSEATPQLTLAKCLGPRPADARSALDQAVAMVLTLIGYVDIADPLLQSAATPPESVPK